MDPLAFVEVLGRHNEVLDRQPVYRWPARVGRGYDAEVILDDPFVAPRHVQIEPATDGRFRVSDLQSVNGMSLVPSARRVTEAEVGPEDLLRLGHTQIRIRSSSYAVQAELALQAVSLYRRPAAFAAMAALVIALVVWNAWIATAGREDKVFFVYPAVGACTALAVWISVWSLVGTVGGRANFAAHGFAACAGLLALMLIDTLGDYLSFGFSAHWLEWTTNAAGALVFATMIYRHLRLNSRAPRRRLAVFAGIASAAVTGLAIGLDLAQDASREGRLRYDATVKPPAFVWVSGSAPEAFLAKGQALKDKADKAARADAR
jgi:FHA domain-containing protein